MINLYLEKIIFVSFIVTSSLFCLGIGLVVWEIYFGDTGGTAR